MSAIFESSYKYKNTATNGYPSSTPPPPTKKTKEKKKQIFYLTSKCLQYLTKIDFI